MEKAGLREIKLLRLKNYWGNIPQNILERYDSGERKDFILENLQSHDWKKLVRSLQSEFGTDQIRVVRSSQGEKSFISLEVRGSKDFPVSNIISSFRLGKARDICNFYGYTLSGSTGNLVELEPEWPDTATSFIYGKCKGVAWHLCPEDVADSVLEKGLRCRNRDTDNSLKNIRNYPKRIFVYAVPSFDRSKIQEGLEQLADTISDGEATLDDFQVIRIDLPGTGLSGRIPFYWDEYTEDGACCFTYTNIPAGWLTPVEF